MNRTIKAIRRTKFLPNTPKKFVRNKHDVAAECRFSMSELKDYEEVKAKLSKVSTFVYESKYDDIYYDYMPDKNQPNLNPYQLTKNDTWLRKRNGLWEMKFPSLVDGISHVRKKQMQTLPSYEYTAGEKLVRRQLNMQQNPVTIKNPPSLDQELAERGIKQFAKFSTTIAEYTLDRGHFIQFISTDFNYYLGLVIGNIPEGDKEEFDDFLDFYYLLIREHNLDAHPAKIHEPVVEYIRRNASDHMHALIDASIIPNFTTVTKKFDRFIEKEKERLKKDEEAETAKNDGESEEHEK